MSNNHLAKVDEQLDAVCGQLARRVRALHRPNFAIIEASACSDNLHWPWKSSFSGPKSEAFWRLLDAVSPKLSGSGVWMTIADDSNSLAIQLHPTNTVATRTSSQSAKTSNEVAAMEQVLAEVIVNGNDWELCRLLSLLSNDFGWLGVYVQSRNVIELSPLLRHCEIAFAAMNGSARFDTKLQREIQTWKKAKIPLQGAFQVSAA